MSTIHPKGDKLLYHCTKSENCHRKFSQKFRLKMHEKIHLSYSKREFACYQCENIGSQTTKRFLTPSQLRAHQKVVHGNGIVTDVQQILEQGVKIHSGPLDR